MKGRVLIALILALSGIGFTRVFGAATPSPPGSLPYYDSRDFTPRWTSEIGRAHV